MKNIVTALEPQQTAQTADITVLGAAQPGYRGFICGINAADVLSSCSAHELERRLLEMGFVEGSAVEILHEGTFRGDPIAVRVGTSTVALRRREAMAIIVA